MRLLAHRGYWKEAGQKNTKKALVSALEKGYGIESDIRDYHGNLVISHDIPDRNAVPLEEILAEFKGRELCFAANIKADGLRYLIRDWLDKYAITQYFAFDMSIPQMLEYRDAGVCFFTRQSDIETEPVLYADAAGVWLDSFGSYSWINESLIVSHLGNGKKVCIVSPELHGMDHTSFWQHLSRMDTSCINLYLCTDLPDEASVFFAKQSKSKSKY